MARYILNFEDTGFPYQAVIKTAADGTYIGQIPLSASLVGFSGGQAGSSAQVTVLPMGGFGSTTIQFDDYDWAKCVPAPTGFNTNAKIMAYLSTYFSGQAISPTPTTPQSMIYNTTPIIALDGSSGLSSYIPFVCGSGIPDADFNNVTTLGVGATIISIYARISENTLNQPLTITLLQDGVEIAQTETTGGAEVLLFGITDDKEQQGGGLYFRLSSTSTSGVVGISSIVTSVELA